MRATISGKDTGNPLELPLPRKLVSLKEVPHSWREYKVNDTIKDLKKSHRIVIRLSYLVSAEGRWISGNNSEVL